MVWALDHTETGKTGLEMASGVMSVLVNTKSTESLRAVGCGRYSFVHHISTTNCEFTNFEFTKFFEILSL